MFLGYIDTDMNVFAHWYYHYLSIPADVTAHICMHVNIQYMDICIYVYIIIYVYIYMYLYIHMSLNIIMYWERKCIISKFSR